MQAKVVERKYRHDDWMEEQKRNLFLQKVNDLAEGVGSPTNASMNVSQAQQDPNWRQKPTSLLDTIKLDSEKREEEEK